jgi:ABC-2 type transport system ATP-binding protein
MNTHAVMVAAQGVTKRYGPVTALHQLTLDIEGGEVFCLLGPNGSGKTTLMRMLAGFFTPSSGSLRIGGWDTRLHPMQSRRLIGYVPESAPLYRHMRVREFLVFMARLRGMDGARIASAIADVAERLNLTERLDAPIPTLSRGYRQRVALAQALVHDPPLLILDEPTNGLDPRQIIEVRQLIRSLARSHTILMSSHILSEVEKTADRIGVLLDGQLRGVGAIAQMPDLESWFLSLA